MKGHALLKFCLYFFYARKIYVLTYVKITGQWKSTFLVAEPREEWGVKVPLVCEQALLFRRENARARGRSLARSRETRFSRPKRKACSQAKEPRTKESSQLSRLTYYIQYDDSSRFTQLHNQNMYSWRFKNFFALAFQVIYLN